MVLLRGGGGHAIEQAVDGAGEVGGDLDAVLLLQCGGDKARRGRKRRGVDEPSAAVLGLAARENVEQSRYFGTLQRERSLVYFNKMGRAQTAANLASFCPDARNTIIFACHPVCSLFTSANAPSKQAYCVGMQVVTGVETPRELWETNYGRVYRAPRETWKELGYASYSAFLYADILRPMAQ